MLAVTLSLVVSLLAPLVAAEADTSPFNPLTPFAFRRDVRYAKRQGCPSIYVECGSDGCMPAGAVCCGEKGYCDAGDYCATGGCCPVGRICRGTAGTTTVDLYDSTDYPAPTNGDNTGGQAQGQQATNGGGADNSMAGPQPGDTTTAVGGVGGGPDIPTLTDPGIAVTEGFPGATSNGLPGTTTNGLPGTTAPGTLPVTAAGSSPSTTDVPIPQPAAPQNAARRVAPAGGLAVAALVAWML